jgi:YVTN family beta-propeller protein
MRIILASVILSSLFLGTASAQPFAYVVNQGSNDASIINTSTNDIEFGSPISVGEEPNAIAIAPDGKLAYVLVAQGVAIVDTTTNRQIGSPISVGARDTNLNGIAITPDGTRILVTNWNQESVE